MSEKNEPGSRASQSEIVITRIFNAPLKLVWDAWTNPEHLKKWWGPKNYTAPVIKTDFKEGGKYHWCMKGPDGKEYWTTGVIREIVPMKRIVYTDAFADEHGKVISAAAYGLPGEWPEDSLVTITFEESEGKTKMVLRHSGIPSGEISDQTQTGWNESFDKLADSLN